MSYQGSVTFTYTAKDSDNFKYDSSFPELLPEETVTIEIPCYDLNVHQYFAMFRKFLFALGFCERVFLDGAFRVAFSDANDSNIVDKLMEEYEIQDKQYYTTEDYENLNQEYKKLQKEVLDLKARLSRCENPDAPNHTDEEISAMNAEESYKPWGDCVPGSREAVMLGCLCPIHDNAEMPDDRKWVNGDCPLHGKKQ
jgi:hypothetical protein